jgi:hypothetical protein
MPRLPFAVLLVVAVAGPAVAAPRLKPEKKDAPPLAGTSWVGKTAEGWDMTIDFLPEGKMTVSYNGASYNKASWKQDGDKVYYEMNDRYCEFEGKLAADAIEGETHNVRGKRWTTSLTRIARDK